MIVTSVQPYWVPYPGFFAKIGRADVVVLLDSVQFPQRTTWMTRNRFKNEQGTLWMTIPVWRKGRGFQKISEVRICHGRSWARKHLTSLKSAYGRAPFFREHTSFLADLFGRKREYLLEMNVEAIRYALDCLNISTRIVYLSELGVEEKEPGLTVSLCRRIGATSFVAPRAARKYLDEPALGRAGIELRLLAPRPPVYPQLYGDFIANLSVYDLIFSCGPEAARIVRESTADDR